MQRVNEHFVFYPLPGPGGEFLNECKPDCSCWSICTVALVDNSACFVVYKVGFCSYVVRSTIKYSSSTNHFQ